MVGLEFERRFEWLNEILTKQYKTDNRSENMRTRDFKYMMVAGVLGAVGAITGLFMTVVGQTVPQPVLTIGTIGTNVFNISITNGVGFANYEIYRADSLDSLAYPWTLHLIGSLGQSNFTVTSGNSYSGFFRAAVGNDWDGDGVPNYMDANPSDALVGALTIIIDSPTNGTVFN